MTGISALESIIYRKGLGHWIKYLKNPEEANEEIVREALKVFGKALSREKGVYLDKDFSISREIRREEIVLKILEEIPYIKVKKKKVLGILPSTSIFMNPGYEEFFHEKLGEYGVNEIYSALRNLERRLSGGNREKVKALRREFERREGISRKKKLAILTVTVLLIGVSAAAGIYCLHKRWEEKSRTTTSTTTPTTTIQTTPTTSPTETSKTAPPPVVTQATPITSPSKTSTTPLSPTITKITTPQTPPVDTTTLKPNLTTITTVIPEKPEIYSVQLPEKLSTNSFLPITVKADADKVLAEIIINEIKKNVSLIERNGVFVTEIPVKEGIYSVDKIYALKGDSWVVKEVDKVYEVFDKPIIEEVNFKKEFKPGEIAVISVRATDTSGIKAIELLLKVYGELNKFYANYENGLYVFRIPLKRESKYNFSINVYDVFGQVAKYSGSFSAFDKPSINSINIEKDVESGIVKVLVNASDFSGIEKALIEISGKNASMIKLPNGLYAYNVSMGEDPATLPIKVYVLDPYKQASSASGEINWLLKDAYTYWAVKQGVPSSKAKEFYAEYEELVKHLYPGNREELIAPLHVYDLNASLLNRVKQKIYADELVKDKLRVFLEVSKALYGLHEKSLNDVSIDYLGDLTNYLKANPLNVFDKITIWNVLNVSERTPIVITGLSKKYWLKGHDTYILTYLVEKTPESTKYPYVLWALSSQAGEIARLISKKHPAVLFAVKGDIDNFSLTDTYGTNYSYIQLVNIRLNQILRNYKNGLWLIGVEPSEILKKSGDKLTSDLWMKQVVMPFSIISGDALKGDRLPYIYPELAENFPQKAVLLVFRDNLEAIDKFSKIINDYLNGKLTWVNKWGEKWDVETWSKKRIETISRYNKEAGRDWQALYEKGSEMAKMGAKIIFGNFGNPGVVKKYGISPIKMEEFRVSQKIITGATVGVPIFANTVKDSRRLYHGMSSIALTVGDYELLKNIDPSPLFLDPITKVLLYKPTRKNANYIDYPVGREEPAIVLWRMSYPVIGVQKSNSEWVVIYKLSS